MTIADYRRAALRQSVAYMSVGLRVVKSTVGPQLELMIAMIEVDVGLSPATATSYWGRQSGKD